jgi:hypothetical protein
LFAAAGAQSRDWYVCGNTALVFSPQAIEKIQLSFP